ncbi:MAG: beta-galactosidase [Clostridia bacterium]|nr:beta-galactosidase [Clostridia bacterium]
MGRILHGAAYYPEDWDDDLIDFDIEKMKETGLNVVRIAEFAWSRMEPNEGEYDFAWLHRIVDKMRKAGISVIMGTPTATPPSWLTKKYPDMLALMSNGAIRSHGGRRHCCSNNPHYLEYSAKIVEKLASEFENDEGIIGWQIDNEIYHWPNADGTWQANCHCEHCVAAFHKHLYAKYGSVENVNKAWNLNLFSQKYDEIEDIPAPYNTWHNPHIKLEWNLSQSNGHVRFVHMQAAIIEKYHKAPIGTDTMPVNGFNYRELNDKLGVAQFNHYAVDLRHQAFYMDYMRHFSKIPFWHTETQACWPGSTCMGHELMGDGFIYMNSWLPISLGGEAILYWLWRTHWAGHELMHGAVLDTSGRYTYANHEIRKASSEFNAVKDFLPEYKVEADTALLFSSLNWNIKTTQDINDRLLDGDQGLVYEFYKYLLTAGIHTDVIDAKEDLDKYKLVFTPSALTLEEHDFGKRIEEWVKNGGVWVTGPMSDIRTAIGTKYKTSPYGYLEDITGERLTYITPDDRGTITLENEVGNEVHGRGIYELFELKDAESLLTVKKGNAPLIGKSVSFVKKIGKGYVVMLGTMPEHNELLRIIKKAATLANAEMYDVGEGIMVTKRVKDDDTLLIVAQIADREGEYRFDGEYTDILSGETFKERIAFNPYELRILRKK